MTAFRVRARRAVIALAACDDPRGAVTLRYDESEVSAPPRIIGRPNAPGKAERAHRRTPASRARSRPDRPRGFLGGTSHRDNVRQSPTLTHVQRAADVGSHLGGV